RPEAAQGAGAIQGGRPPALAQGDPDSSRARGRRRASQAVDDHVRRLSGDRPPLPSAGRDRHAVLRDDRLRLARRQKSYDSRPRYDGTRARGDRRARSDPSGEAQVTKKWVYLFAEGNATMRNLLGGKGAGVAEMTRAG